MSKHTSQTPLQLYQEQIADGFVQHDADQEPVIKALDELHHLLQKPSTLLTRLGLLKPKSIRGIYLWGSVGTGKTFLMDTFFHCLPSEKKLRMHFHAFMQLVHTELIEHKGVKDPLTAVAKTFASKATILCLDELIVNDIADAMLLAGFFTALYEQGVTLLFTSNIPPDRLYEKGLQRQQFLPAIELIKAHSHVIELNTHMDYRQQYQTQHSHHYYLQTYDNDCRDLLEQRFNDACNPSTMTTEPITLHGRTINVIKRCKHIVWFDFLTICSVPRSQKDFLSLAKHYSTIIISDLPCINSSENNLIRSFINLVDVLYDMKVVLIISAQKPIHQIYTQGKYLFPFARTQSRITEMQAENWQL